MPTLVLKRSTRIAVAANYTSWYLDQIAMIGKLRFVNNANQVKKRIDRESGRFNSQSDTWGLEDIRQEDWAIDQMTEMLTTLNSVEDKGVECLEYPSFITMSKIQYEQDDVPNYMPNNDELDPEGNPIRNLKWFEWRAPNYSHRRNVEDTEYYIPTNSNNDGYYVSGVNVTRLESEPYVMTEMLYYPDGVDVDGSEPSTRGKRK